jgi:hypothetical protein
MRRFLAVMVLSGCVANGNDPSGQSQQPLGGSDQCSDPMNCKPDGTGGNGGGSSTGDPCAPLDATECAQKAPFCQPVVDCPPCDNATDPTMCSERPCTFVGCKSAVPPDPCAGLGEQACNQTSGCQGSYATVCKAADGAMTDPNQTKCPDPTNATDCQMCGSQFSGCHADNLCGAANGDGGTRP